MANVDLQVASISPQKASIGKGKQTSVVVEMKNNGPGPISKGSAQVKVTVSWFSSYKPSQFNFYDKSWKLDIVEKVGDSYVIHTRNAKALPQSTSHSKFKFSVKGRKPGKIDLTVASTLSRDTMDSDIDGSNQSATTEIIVK